MKTIEVCPSTLRPGFSTYSPQAVKELFDGVVVSPFIDIDFENERDQQQAMENMNNMSISGAQEKFSAIIDEVLLQFS
jgi:serine/threonine-protein kinase HipA